MPKRRRRQAKQTTQLDIVIPVYGRPDLLTKCLDSIRATIGDISHQIIIVDDMGPDQEKLNEVYASLNGHSTSSGRSNSRVSRNKENQGFPVTVNRGISLGGSPYVLILNTDIELQPGAIEAMVQELDDNPDVGIVAPKLLFPEGTPYGPAGKVQHVGLCVTFDGQIVHGLIGWPSDHPKVNKRRVAQAVTGACIMTRRDVLKSIHQSYKKNGDPTTGAFNDVYSPGTFEDVEYSFAVRALGYLVIVQPQAVAYHHVGGSSAVIKKGFPLQRNANIFQARCGNMLYPDEWEYL